MPRKRFGVALLIPAPLDREVDGLRLACGDGSLGRIPPHLTLVPPVNVREDEVASALSVLRAAAAEVRPLTLTLGPVATFHPDTPVLYLAVGGEVEALQRLRDLVFRPPLERTLTWPFTPHVTLAEELPAERLAAAVSALADYRVEVEFDRVHLLEERKEGDDVRRWVPIADVPLEPAWIVGRGGLPLELTVSERLDPEAEQAGPDRRVVTARREGRVVGYAIVVGDDVIELFVVPEERDTGVEEHLLRGLGSPP